jgi:hypothetical protein
MVACPCLLSRFEASRCRSPNALPHHSPLNTHTHTTTNLPSRLTATAGLHLTHPRISTPPLPRTPYHPTQPPPPSPELFGRRSVQILDRSHIHKDSLLVQGTLDLSEVVLGGTPSTGAGASASAGTGAGGPGLPTGSTPAPTAREQWVVLGSGGRGDARTQPKVLLSVAWSRAGETRCREWWWWCVTVVGNGNKEGARGHVPSLVAGYPVPTMYWVCSDHQTPPPPSRPLTPPCFL